jgi:hypothetical protein
MVEMGGLEPPTPLHAKQGDRFDPPLLHQSFWPVKPLSPHFSPHEDCLKNRL